MIRSLTLLLLFSSFQVFSSDCSSFSSKWEGLCSNDSIVDIDIEVQDCSDLTLDGVVYKIGKSIQTKEKKGGEFLQQVTQFVHWGNSKKVLIKQKIINQVKIPANQVIVQKSTYSIKDKDSLFLQVQSALVSSSNPKRSSQGAYSCLLNRIQ